MEFWGKERGLWWGNVWGDEICMEGVVKKTEEREDGQISIVIAEKLTSLYLSLIEAGLCWRYSNCLFFSSSFQRVAKCLAI